MNRLLILIFIIQNYIFSQNIIFTAKCDSTEIRIGSATKINLNVKYKTPTKIIWSGLKDSIGAIAILEKNEVARKENEENVTIIISAYEAGKYNFQIPILAISKNETTQVFSNAIILQVKSIQIDTTKPFKDIKPPKTLPISLEEILFWFGIIVLIVALTYAIIYFWKKRKLKTGELKIEEEKIPPFDLAMQKLNEIEKAKIWQNGNLKKYYSDVTMVVREYFENEFKISALESTTNEFLKDLKVGNFNKNILDKIKESFELADLVKFAKQTTTLNENENAIIIAREIIELTKPNADTIRK